VISDTAQSAQDTAQCKLDHALLDDAKAVKLATKRGPSDDAPIPSLSAILQEVQNTTICLMRLSRPLLNDHLHHQTTTQHCDKDKKAPYLALAASATARDVDGVEATV
jgi:hypothetical protein